MGKIIIPVIFILFLILHSFFATYSFAQGKKVHWSQKKVEIVAEREDSFSVDVSFIGDKDLSDVSLRIPPELQPFITASPTKFETINKGSEHSVILNIAIPADTANGLYNGTIRLKKTHKDKGGDGSSDDKKKKDKKKKDKNRDKQSHALKIELSIVDNAGDERNAGSPE